MNSQIQTAAVLLNIVMPSRILTLITLFSLFTLWSCVRVSDQKPGQIKAKDYVGEWVGSLPCADCDAVDYKLTLNKDKTYLAVISYLGVGQAEPNRTEGSWMVSDDLILIMDSELKDTLSLLPEDGDLVVLGPQGSRMNGPEAKYYKLSRSSQMQDSQSLIETEENGFRASGHSPEWELLMVFDKYIRFTTPNGDTVATPVPVAQTKDTKGLYYVASAEGKALTVSIQRDSCQADGVNNHFSVEVTVDQDTFAGCGAYHYDAELIGRWVLQGINGRSFEVESAQKVPEMIIGKEGLTVTGNTGCNTYNGLLWVEGTKLRVNGITLTRMNCPGDMESRFLEVMESRPSFRIDGNLLKLESPDGTAFLLQRAEGKP